MNYDRVAFDFLQKWAWRYSEYGDHGAHVALMEILETVQKSVEDIERFSPCPMAEDHHGWVCAECAHLSRVELQKEKVALMDHIAKADLLAQRIIHLYPAPAAPKEE